MNPTESQTANPNPERRVASLLTPLLERLRAAQSDDDIDALAEIDALLAAFAAAIPAPPRSQGDAITRDKIEVHAGGHYQPDWKVDKVEINPPPPDPAEIRAADAESAYLRRLRQQCNALPLAQDSRSAGDRDNQAKTPELVNVYVDLQVNTDPTLEQVFQRLSVPTEQRNELRQRLEQWVGQSPGEKNQIQPKIEDMEALRVIRTWAYNSERDDSSLPLYDYAEDTGDLRAALGPLSALEALAANRRLVLLGDPGGGKSTFVNHLAYLCAGARLGEEADWQAVQDNLFPAPLLPLRVIVRRWSSSLTAQDEAGPELVYAGLMEATGLERDALLKRLVQPDTLVLLDGLDEAPGADPNDPASLDRRRLIVESVDAFCVARPTCRVIVTCRVKPYAQPAYRLRDVPSFTLVALDDARIENFLRRWYGEMARTGSNPAKAEADRAQLQSALGRRPDLRQMAAIPLLATMLARVNARSGLPDNRVDLYYECVEQLLWEWEAAKSREGGERSGLVDLLQAEGVGLQRGDLERVLWELTFTAHAQSGAATADLPAAALRAKLAAKHPRRHDGWAWADRVVALMAERSGLLMESETGTFTFPHRTFQEYLAARWLLEQEDCPQQAAALAASDTWREVVLLACGYATSKSAFNTTQAILFELAAGTEFATEEARRRLLVAGQGWLEFGPHRAVGATGSLLKEQMPSLLTHLMQDREIPSTQRLEAGLLLADLHILPPDLDEFVLLPRMESVPYAFKIGKYPITNVQYRCFVEAGGYDEEQPWWTKQTVAELDRYSTNWRNAPRYWDTLDFNRSTQPVVGVSWYEAMAYCVWLTDELRRKGEISTREEVRLPKEEEWERAARGPHSRPLAHTGKGEDAPHLLPRSRRRIEKSRPILSDFTRSRGRVEVSHPHASSSSHSKRKIERIYPWGEDFDPAWVNTEESNLNQTSPVHQYPDGSTLEGVWDMAGNVYEWTAQIDADGVVPVRGGAFWSGAESVTVSSRDRDDPRDRSRR